MDNSFEEPKVPQKDLVDIKFAVIEYLYEFLKEDIERIRDTKSSPFSTEYQAKLDLEEKKGSTQKSFGKKTVLAKMSEVEDKKYEDFKKYSTNENLKTEGTKNFRALYNSDLPEALVYFLQHNATNYELNVLVLEVLNLCVMYKELVKKFCSVGLLKDIVRPADCRSTTCSTRRTSSARTRSGSASRSCGTPSRRSGEKPWRTSPPRTSSSPCASSSWTS